jgi:hypothetical protein
MGQYLSLVRKFEAKRKDAKDARKPLKLVSEVPFPRGHRRIWSKTYAKLQADPWGRGYNRDWDLSVDPLLACGVEEWTFLRSTRIDRKSVILES